MLSIIFYAGTFAFGRMSKDLTMKSWAILFLIALASIGVALLMGQLKPDLTALWAFAVQLAIFVVVYGLGVALGRWLDRNKEYE